MFFRKPQPDRLRPIVLQNLTRLALLFKSRGRRFSYDASLPTNKLEDALWHVLEVTGRDMGLSFAPGMACEARISEIIRNLPPLASRGQWPFAR